MKILGVVGRNGSGKDEVVSYLQARCGIARVSAGDVLREIAETRNMSPTRENLHALSQKVMQENGRDYVARRVIRIIETHPWDAVGVSGVRTPDDVAAFRSRFGPDFRLAYVRVGDPKIRFKRLRERREPRDPRTLEEFKEQERSEEAQFEIGRAIKQADVVIRNDAGLKALHRHIQRSPLWEWLCPSDAPGT